MVLCARRGWAFHNAGIFLGSSIHLTARQQHPEQGKYFRESQYFNINLPSSRRVSVLWVWAGAEILGWSHHALVKLGERRITLCWLWLRRITSRETKML